MATLYIITLCFVLLAGATNAWKSISLPEGTEVGDDCTSTIRNPSRCGKPILLGTTETPVNNVQGPNVCNVTKMYMQQTCSYTYQQYCGRQHCFTFCVADGCNGSFVNFTKSSLQCCDGFAQGEPMEPESGATGSFFSSFYRCFGSRRKPSQLQTNGCPVELIDSVFDCLEELDVSSFLSQVVLVQGLEERLRSPENEEDPTTVFAISDEALANLDDITRALLFSDIARESIVSSHIGVGQVPEKKLFRGRLIDTLASNVTLHIGQTGNCTDKEFFANGIRISQTNACQARNGVVHIVDDVFPFSSSTINDILVDQSSRFSIFQNLTEKAGIAQLLDTPRKSRTVFAPTDDAFEEIDGLVECLCFPENSRYLSQFVLIHISSPAEYTSTLSQRFFISTFSYWYLRVNSTGEGITITNNAIPLSDPDISARNGVIHAIPEVILPFSTEQLEKICPDIGATMEPSTEPPSAIIIEPEATPDPDGIPPGGVIIPPENVGR